MNYSYIYNELEKMYGKQKAAKDKLIPEEFKKAIHAVKQAANVTAKKHDAQLGWQLLVAQDLLREYNEKTKSSIQFVLINQSHVDARYDDRGDLLPVNDKPWWQQ